MNKIELKPCPFCGGEAELIKMKVSFHDDNNSYDGIAIRVKCKTCEATSPYKRSKMHGWFKLCEEEKAIEAWNRRYERKMSDLISREWCLTEYDKRHKGLPGNARKIMEEAPAVDTVPVVHGHWDIERHRRICSVCGDCNDIRDHEGDFIADSYCPNCGAEMDGEG